MSIDHSQDATDEHAPHRSLATLGDAANLLYPVVPTTAMCAAARAYGRLRSFREPDKMRVLTENLSQVPGITPERAKTLARWAMEEREIRSLLLVLTPQLTLGDMQQMFKLDGLEHLDEALAQGKGVMLLLSHMHSLGAFVGIAMLRKLGYDVQVSLPSAHDPWSDSRLRAVMHRALGPRPSIPELVGGFYCQFNIRPMVERLQKNVIIAQTGDGWHSAAFVDCDFMGRKLPFTTGVISVARSTESPVVPMFVGGRAPHMRFTLDRPMAVDRGPDGVANAVRAYVGRLEHHLMQTPHCWEHFTIEHTFDAMLAHRDKLLRDKYLVKHG
jgi:lauroyl/myristoyl acyltransferase